MGIGLVLKTTHDNPAVDSAFVNSFTLIVSLQLQESVGMKTQVRRKERNALVQDQNRIKNIVRQSSSLMPFLLHPLILFYLL